MDFRMRKSSEHAAFLCCLKIEYFARFMSIRSGLRFGWLNGVLLIWLALWCSTAVESGQMRHEPLHEINGRVFYGAEGHIVEVQSITTYCLSCHDGTIAPLRQGPSDQDRGDRMQNRGMPGLHPVEVRYPIGDRSFKTTEELPSAMLMTEGRVTCVTCHRFDSEDHELVVSNRRSGLCLTCHRK